MSKENNSDRQTNKTPRPTDINIGWKSICTVSNICFIISLIMVIVGVVMISNSIRRGAEAANEAYDKSKQNAADEAYHKFYQTAFDSAERKYHVANRATIEVEAVREKADLEVLRVSDVEYVIKNTGNTEAWAEYFGEGVYTVDMRESEFIIDSERQYVLVRVPRPVITNCRITKSNTLFLESTGFRNGNDAAGVALAEGMRIEGYSMLSNYMKSDTEFYKSAKNSAEIAIESLVKGLNPDLQDLEVDVEFVE